MPSARSGERLTTTRSGAAAVPAPGDEVVAGAVVGPPVDVEAGPRPPPDAPSERGEQAVVPRPQVAVGFLDRAPPERHRHADRPPVGLALVEQGDAGQGQRGHRRGAGRPWRQHGRQPRLVVVLDEANRVGLVRDVGAEVVADRAGTLAVGQPVVEALVVAGVEALGDEHRLEVPVRLGPEHEVGVLGPHGGDDRRPVAPTAVGGRAAGGPLAPGPGEDVVEHQHGHVAAHTVGPFGDRRQHGRRRGPRVGA